VTIPRRPGLSIATAFAVLAIAIGLLASAFGPSASAQDGSATPGASPEASPSATPAFTFAIDATQSTAGYQVEEELQSVGTNTVVGTTQAILGNILFNEAMMPLAGTRVDVDLRTLATDEPRRDNYLYDNVLETGEFPLATFIVTSTSGLNGGLVDGQEVTFQLIGDLTIHGVTNEATWDVTATLSGDSLTGTATTTFTLDQYDMEKPIVGPVVSIDDTITLNLDVVAIKSA
jgi:polyisoprenoid-binding protein YceI